MLSTTASINIDLQRPSIIVIHAKQFDALSRYAEIHLFSGGEPWAVEGSITYAVQYHKPDGTKGLYDKLPDGETDAVSASTDASGATVLHVRFAPQMFAVAGKVKCSIAMMQSDGTKLQTFSFAILVDQSEVIGDESKDYYKMATLEGLQTAIGDLSKLSTAAKDSLVEAINEVLGKITAGGVTSVAGKTGAVTLGAEDIAAQIDGTEVKTVADALVALLAAIGDLTNLSTEAKDSLVAAINEVLGKIPKSVVASVNGKTGEVTLDAGDIALHADLSDDLPAKSTVQAALEYLRNKLQNVDITPAEGAYVVVENEADAAVMRKFAAKAEELRQGYEIGVGNVAMPIINTEDSAEYMHAAHIVRSEAEKEAAAGDVEVPSVGRVGEMIAENTPTVDETAIQEAVKAAQNAQQTADNAATAAAYTVKYTAQDLSASQKKQVRKNIGAPEMGVTDVTPEWLAWCDDKGIADADCTESDVFSFLTTLSSGIYCLTTGFFGQVWALIYGAYAKRLVAVIEGRVYVGGDTVISDSGELAYGEKKAKITDIADSVYKDVTSSYEAANTSGTLTPAEYVKRLAKDGKYRIRIGSIGDALFEKMTVDGSKWLFGRSTDGVSVSYTIDRDDTTVLSMSTAGTAKIGDKTVLTDAFIAKPTLADAGKVLTVGAGGNPEWTAVVNAEEVAV